MLQAFRSLCKYTVPFPGFSCSRHSLNVSPSSDAKSRSLSTAGLAAVPHQLYKVKDFSSSGQNVRLAWLRHSLLISGPPSAALSRRNFASMHFAPPSQRLGGRMYFASSFMSKTGLAGQHPVTRRHNPAKRSNQLVAYAASAAPPKAKKVYHCTDCSKKVPMWSGKCPECGAWNTIEESYEEKVVPSGGGGGVRAANAYREAPERRQRVASNAAASTSASSPSLSPRAGTWIRQNDKPQRLEEISRGVSASTWRLPLPGPVGTEVSRVLGGGVVPGALILVGGDPGIGKSTLLLQLAGLMSTAKQPSSGSDSAGSEDSEGDTDAEDATGSVLYVSGEESVDQVANRGQRMGLADGGQDVFLYSATRLDDIMREMYNMRPRAVIIDSIQTVYLDEVASSAGSVTQVRECATALLHMAKQLRTPIFLVGHVTKTGDIAGPRVLEHVVDVVLYLEGERHQSFRLLRGIKNRHGATDEVGVFQMQEEGLMPVADPSVLFVSDRTLAPGVSGAVTVMMEGTRPMLIEVQALCSAVPQNQPAQRVPNGLSRNRLSLILAVLSKHAHLQLHSQDLHINVVGGMTVVEPATDLAVAMAVASSFYEQPTPADCAVVGEIGLGGELRTVSHIERRIMEAAKLGYASIIIPAACRVQPQSRFKDINIIQCRSVKEAVERVMGRNLVPPKRATRAKSMKDAAALPIGSNISNPDEHAQAMEAA